MSRNAWKIVPKGLLVVVAATLLQVVVLRWASPPASSFMMADAMRARVSGDDGWTLRHRWVAWDGIAPSVKLAVVASEDQRFPTHRGFDLEAIEDAIEEYRRGEGLRGGSTITQQVARNLFLWRGGGFFRKGLEAYYTVLIEATWPKRRILEVYLNVAEFGPGIYGVDAASETFFRTTPDRLTDRQAALLATVLPSPRKMRADRPSAYVAGRADVILGLMRSLGADHLSGI